MHPRNGPTLGILILIIPFQVMTNLITHDRQMGEIIYIALQVIFWSLLTYPFLFALKKSGPKDKVEK